jgi:hyperosmotically inducible periplasmic protein
MKVSGWIVGLALGALVTAPLATTPAWAQTTAAKVDDSTIKTRVEARLKNADSLKNDTIIVSVDSGVVTLTGTVHSEAQKLRARQLANVSGVTRVENKLDVDSKTERAMDKAGEKTKDAAEKTKDATVTAAKKTKDATVKGAEKTKDAAVKVGEKTKEVAGTTGEAITDAWITTKVKADFVNEDTLKGSDINVDTNNHVVTLKGTVASAAGKARAEQIAKTTKGVNSVINTLTIGPKK